MIRSMQFRRLFSRNRFAEALAWRRTEGALRSSEELYAWYRLGLYQTVAGCTRADADWRGGFALAVSLAACGRTDEAASIARALVAGDPPPQTVATLADALSPFAASLAWELIENRPVPASLRAAVLLRLGKKAEAAQLLRSELNEGLPPSSPELSLYLSNAEPAGPAGRLALLNTFLATHSLPAVALRDSGLPPGPLNLCAAKGYAPVHGPVVSVLMTAWRTGRRIEPAIASLLAQSYRDIELIVIDDASDDDTGEVVQAMAAKDPRVVYLCLPRNVGTYVAKTIGLRHASGEFVTCQDSDDWAHPLKIERQVRPLLEERKLVFSTSHWVRMTDEGEYYARPVHPLMRLNPASPLFRRELVVKKAGVWDAVRTGADSEFLARLKLVFGRKAMRRIAEPLTLGAHRADSLMNAAETGYGAAGISPTRLAYWESWGHWHVESLARWRKPRLPADRMAERCFPAPAEIVVPREDIAACLASRG